MIPLFKIYKPVIDYNKFDHNLHGSIVTEFENAFAEYTGFKYAVGTNSCTSAIFLVAKWYQENFGKTRVNIPTMIPPVVYNALYHAGCNIGFVDFTFWIGGNYILYNNDKNTIWDCAHELPNNAWNEKDTCLYSFYPTKPIAGIDGGMIVTNNKELYEWLRIAVMNGMGKGDSWGLKYHFPGWKYYMSSAQAYVAYEQFKRIGDKKNKLIKVKEWYDKFLDIKCFYPSDHLYILHINDNKKFIKYMKKNGIQCGIHYKCLHPYVKYEKLWPKTFKRSNELENNIASIPFHEDLTKKDIKYIARLINEYNK